MIAHPLCRRQRAAVTYNNDAAENSDDTSSDVDVTASSSTTSGSYDSALSIDDATSSYDSASSAEDDAASSEAGSVVMMPTALPDPRKRPANDSDDDSIEFVLRIFECHMNLLIDVSIICRAKRGRGGMLTPILEEMTGPEFVYRCSSDLI